MRHLSIRHTKRVPRTVVLVVLGFAIACGASREGDIAANERATSSSTATTVEAAFTDVTSSTGLDFAHDNGMTGQLFLVEAMGSGGGYLDYDGDGDLDIYLLQSGALGAAGSALSDQLFQNLLVETGSLQFTEVTEKVGLRAYGYGMGVAVGDYDGDGDPDIYLSNFGPNQLWENDAGRFREVGEEAGVADSSWSTAATWVDFDRDGDLDLFVGNYLDFSLATHRECHSTAGSVDYCGPLAYRGASDRLYRNQGNGTFLDESLSSGIGQGARGALGTVAADLDEDGWLDLYVANDGTENRLWMNQGDGRFVDDAVYSGCATNGAGKAEGSMGVDAGDYDGDGDLDLFMTHIAEETNTLFSNHGRGVFQDVTEGLGLGRPSRGKTGFGTAFLDYDSDGWLDLVVANGLIRIDPEQVRAGESHPLHQANQLLRNIAGSGFEDVTSGAGPAFRDERASRGLAVGDVDNDGDPDLLVTNNNGPARLLRNDIGQQNPWVGLELRTGSPSRFAYGATVRLRLSSGRELTRRVGSDGSYGAANDPRVLIGVPPGEIPVELSIRWPNGSLETVPWGDRPLRAYFTVVEGRDL